MGVCVCVPFFVNCFGLIPFDHFIVLRCCQRHKNHTPSICQCEWIGPSVWWNFNKTADVHFYCMDIICKQTNAVPPKTENANFICVIATHWAEIRTGNQFHSIDGDQIAVIIIIIVRCSHRNADSKRLNIAQHYSKLSAAGRLLDVHSCIVWWWLCGRVSEISKVKCLFLTVNNGNYWKVNIISIIKTAPPSPIQLSAAVCQRENILDSFFSFPLYSNVRNTIAFVQLIFIVRTNNRKHTKLKRNGIETIKIAQM